MRTALCALLLVGCGGGFSASDRQSLRDAVNLASQVLAVEADAGACGAPQIRAMTRAEYCASASILARHGEVIDGGVQCVP